MTTDGPAPRLRRYTYKLYPNAGQAAALENQRRMHSALYNALLQQRIEAWDRRRVSLSFYDQSKEITALRNDPEIGAEWAALSHDSMKRTANRLDLAFKAFFRRARAGAGASSGFPKFHRVDGFGFAAHGNGWRADLDGGVGNGRLRLKGVPGLIRVRGRLPARPQAIRTCDLTLREGSWWLSVVVELPPRAAAPAAASAVVRFNLIEEFAAVSAANGECVAGPEHAVSTADEGRIGEPSPVVLSRRGSAGPETATDRNLIDRKADLPWGSAGPETATDRNRALPSGSDRHGAAGPETATDRNNRYLNRRIVVGAAGPETATDRNRRHELSRRLPGAAGPETATDRNSLHERIKASAGAAGPETATDRNSGSSQLSCEAGAAGPETATDRNDRCVIEPGATGAAGPETATDRNISSSSRAGPSGAAGPETATNRNSSSPSCEARRSAAGPATITNRNESEAPSPAELIDVAAARRIAALDAAMARLRKPGRRASCRYRQLRARRARIAGRTARRRKDALHRWTSALAASAGAVLIVAPPSIRELTRSGRGNARNWGAAVSTKAAVNRHVLGQAPGLAISMIEYKVAERGGRVDVVADDAPLAGIGGQIVRATKANRKLKRTKKSCIETSKSASKRRGSPATVS